MILGLFGAVMAGAVADAVLSNRSDEDDLDPQPEDDVQEVETGFLHYSADSGGDSGLLLVSESLDPPDHEFASERIHSSDGYAPPPLPSPFMAGLADAAGSLTGGALDDTLTGGAGESFLKGHGGNDLLRAGAGPVHMIGGEGDDTLIGGPEDDRLEGGAGDDLLIGGAGSDTLMGGEGNDTLVGAVPWFDCAGPAAPNFLNGGSGDDLLIGGAADYLNGGTGADSFVIGDWITEEIATIVDYQQGEDRILLHLTSSDDAVPPLDIRYAQDAPETAQIWLNDQFIAQVMSAPKLTLDDIVLVPFGASLSR